LAARLIQRSVDYASFGYYSFLAAYALYDTIWGGDTWPIIVIAPLFYGQVSLATLCAIAIPLRLWSCLRDWDKPAKWERLFLNLGIFLGAAVTALVVLFGTASDGRSPILTVDALVFLAIALLEVALHVLGSMFGPTPGEDAIEGWLVRLEGGFPFGQLTLLGLGLGFFVLPLLIPGYNQRTPAIAIGFVVYSAVCSLLIEKINQGLGKVPFPARDMWNPTAWRAVWRAGFLDEPVKREWPVGVSLLFGVCFGVLLTLLLQTTIGRLIAKHPLKLLVALVYALIAWVWWMHARSSRESPEVLN